MNQLLPYMFVGSTATYWMPDDILVEIDIVPDSLIGWVRSGVEGLASVHLTTWHDTGNPGATADHERNFLHNGPRDNRGNKIKVGYNFAADGVPRVSKDGTKHYRGKLIQLTPLNEVTWHAGTAKGNLESWGVEQCFGGSTIWENSLYVTSALHGAILAAQRWDVESLLQHHAWYGKDCPGQIRRRGIWPSVVQMTDARRLQAIAAEAGEQPIEPPTPIYADPVPIPALVDAKTAYVIDGQNTFILVQDQVRATRDTGRYQFADPGAKRVGRDIVGGTTFPAEWMVFAAGEWWYVTRYWTRVRTKDTERISDQQAA